MKDGDDSVKGWWQREMWHKEGRRQRGFDSLLNKYVVGRNKEINKNNNNKQEIEIDGRRQIK